MALKFAVEKFADTMAEAAPLIAEHYREVGLNAVPFDAEPDFMGYARLEQAGILTFIGARDQEDMLAGYSAFMVVPSLAYSGKKIAVNHAIYLLPRYRNGFAVMRLIDFGEQEMQRQGAAFVEYHLWADKDFGRLMEMTGYKMQRIVYSKFAERE